MLISSPAERAERAARKRWLVLRFLRDETWSELGILERVMGLKAREAAHRTLVKMEQENLIKRRTVSFVARMSLTVWGITPHGLAHAWDKHEPYEDRPHFEPSKLALSRVQHHLTLQQVRLSMENAGWREWFKGEGLGFKVKIRPDAVALRPDGLRVAIEVELTVKTRKRYQEIVRNHLMLIRQGGWDAVLYLSDSALRLQRLFDSIDYVVIQGERVALDETHRKRFRALAPENLEEWLDKHRVAKRAVGQ